MLCSRFFFYYFYEHAHESSMILRAFFADPNFQARSHQLLDVVLCNAADLASAMPWAAGR